MPTGRRRGMLGLSIVLSGAFVLALVGGRLDRVRSDDDLAVELPRIPPRAPRQALESFEIHRGFRIEPVATEPLVAGPVCLIQDEDERIYVVEMCGYPFPEDKPTGKVCRLEDRDGDGTYETSNLFLDGLNWPTSVVAYDGGVFIAAPPEILYAKDTDGDGVADVRTPMFQGFGTQNVQALVNGLLWGPDGWIYGVSGGNGGSIQNLVQRGRAPVELRGRDFRFKPDGSAFEAISGGGQFGHAFDDWGHRFTCNNSNHIRQIVMPAESLDRNPALIGAGVLTDIAVEGGAAPVFRISKPEPWRIVRTRQRAADPQFAKRLPPTELVATGFFTSATGVTIYRGSAYPAEYLGNAFIGDVGGNLVHRKILERKSSVFSARRGDQGKEFLASTDNWFRPVSFYNAADGTLWVLDMYRETIEHPLSIPEPIKKHLDLTSGKDLGRIYRIIPEGYLPKKREPLSKLGIDALVAKLASPDSWTRETVQRLLIERRDLNAFPMLIDLAERRPTPLARIHAIWTLESLGIRISDELLGALLIDPEPGVREQAARVAGKRKEPFGKPFDLLVKLADDPDPMVRFQAALALGNYRASADVLAPLRRLLIRDGSDPWTKLAVFSGLKGRAGELLVGFWGKPFDEQKMGQWVTELAALEGAERNPEMIAILLDSFSPTRPRVNIDFSYHVLIGLDFGLRRSGSSLAHEMGAEGRKSLEPTIDRAVKVLAGDAALGVQLRSVRLIALAPVERVLQVLPPLLDARHPNQVQLEALGVLAGLDDPNVGKVVVEHWKSLSPPIRREAVEVLFARNDRLNALLDAIEAKTIRISDLDPVRVGLLREHRDLSIRNRVRGLPAGDVRADRASVLKDYRQALARAGNQASGKLVFRKNCATCHQAEGEGKEVGPPLETVANKSAEDLLVHIIEPNREVAPVYLNYNVATKAGKVVSGVIVGESANAVTLKRAEGVIEAIPRDQIEEIASSGVSLMPEGLEKEIDVQGMADLIAFVRGLKNSTHQ